MSASPVETDAPVHAAIELGPQDCTYLHLDTPRAPMHWAMLLELGGQTSIDVESVRERVAARAKRYRLFRTGIVGGRWRRPRVIEVDEVDVLTQVASASYADDADLHRQVGELMGAHLERGRPFWHITLLSPATLGGRQFLLLRVHHSLSDGIAGAAFSALLADEEGDSLDEFDRFATSPRFHISGIDRDELATAKAAFEESWETGQEGRHWPKLSGSGAREAGWHSVSTRDLRRAAKRSGASVHEYLLAAIGTTISSAPPVVDGGAVSSSSIRVTLPVTLDKEFRHTGNAVSVSLLNLAGDRASVEEQLPGIQDQLKRIERDRPELYLAAADDAPRAPWPIFRVLSGASMKKMSPDIHIGVNPGFTRVRTVLGAPINDLTALSPLVGYSFSVTILILGTRTSFGIVYDGQALPDYGEKFRAAFDAVLTQAAVADA
ncbi:diacylglycerol O-acyltransferase [Gordonia sp. X0973]|uniref:wax ester/triacylglycerol synthase domain-containing protein n=1 Tax=Gordonia sp. X0973 TaxID=2742602 RepID=UPI000F543CED|nr:wax ester/triacylglycerol synthase domain-containing protein [Gordonia sp. X0973]QKT05895.1 diacylglycerol O-acyltransferase [Gordonia sp. X0973]